MSTRLLVPVIVASPPPRIMHAMYTNNKGPLPFHHFVVSVIVTLPSSGLLRAVLRASVDPLSSPARKSQLCVQTLFLLPSPRASLAWDYSIVNSYEGLESR
jgi:hypothetical protein